MTWVLVIGAGWLLLAALTAVLIGRSIRIADAQAARQAAHDEPNVVVDPATVPAGFPSATVLPFPSPARDATQTPTPAAPPTIPGIPVARPQPPGAGHAGGRTGEVRRTGLA